MDNEWETQTPTLEDLLALLDSLKLRKDGTGVVGREEPMSQFAAGESRAASDNLSETTVWGGESSSKVLGTSMQRFRPRATFAFFHLLPIFFFFYQLWISHSNPKWYNPERESTGKSKIVENKAPPNKTRISNGEKLRAFVSFA